MLLRFHMPTKVIVQEEAVVKNHQEFALLGNSCLIVTGKNSAKRCGALDDAVMALEKAGVRWKLFDEVTQNPFLSTCVKAGAVAREMGAQFILGIGGGSPLDAAKAIAVFAQNPNLEPTTVFARQWEHDPLPIALIGTTSGTGSEVTQYAVMTLDENNRKSSIADPRIFATLAFGDPKYTQSLDSRFTVSTGLDALSHCVESYFNKTADPLSDLFALEGARLAAQELAAVGDKAPAEITFAQREALYHSSLYAGVAIARTGTAFCHALGYFLTEEFDLPHGFACAVLLPAYLQESAAHMGDKVAAFEKTVGMSLSALSALIASLTTTEKMGACLPVLTPQAADEVAARFAGGGNLVKSPGNVDREKACAILTQLLV